MSNVQTIEGLNAFPSEGTASVASRVILGAATVGAGLSAGLFYAYQVSVIPAFSEIDDTAYVMTFQAINDKIQNPWFFSVFFGTPLLIGAALALHRRSPRPVTAMIGAALVFNLVLIAITVAGNVPLNDELAGYENITPDMAVAARSDFEDPWNRLNLARTIAAVASFVCLTAATIVTLGGSSVTNEDRKKVRPGDVD